MRQAGVIAAGALYALENHVERLAEDHANAQRLAQAIREIDGLELQPPEVDTNLVIYRVDPRLGTAPDFSARLKQARRVDQRLWRPTDAGRDASGCQTLPPSTGPRKSCERRRKRAGGRGQAWRRRMGEGRAKFETAKMEVLRDRTPAALPPFLFCITAAAIEHRGRSSRFQSNRSRCDKRCGSSATASRVDLRGSIRVRQRPRNGCIRIDSASAMMRSPRRRAYRRNRVRYMNKWRRGRR